MRHSQVATVIDMVEERAKTARTGVEATFDDLMRATEARVIDLGNKLRDDQREWRPRLDEQVRQCSTALVDIWRTIDFLEKVMLRGTDVELLTLKGHLFKDETKLRQWHRWNDMLKAERTTNWSKGTAKAGWRSDEEAKGMLESISNCGCMEMSSLEPIPDVQPNYAPKAEGTSKQTMQITSL